MKKINKKRERGAVHWRAGANQPAQPAKPARPPRAASTPLPRARTRPRRARPIVSGQQRRMDSMRGSPTPRPPPPSVDSASAFAILASTPCAPSRSLSLALSPLLHAHRTATRHWSFPSSLRLVPSASPPPSVFFHLSELRIGFYVLGRAFFAQVSLPRGPNRSPESARPRRSSPRRRCPCASLSRPFLASLARAPWSP